MQLCAGRPADQWRGSVIDDPGNTAKSATRRDSAADSSVGRHQHRSDNGCGADPEYVCLCREHDDESGNAGHDGTGQRHRCRGNAGRIARIAIRLLTRKTSLPRAFARRPMPAQGGEPQSRAGTSQASLLSRRRQNRTLNRYLVVRPTGRAYLGCERPTRLPPEAVGRRADGACHACLPPNQAGGAVRLTSLETRGSCRTLTCQYSRASVQSLRREPQALRMIPPQSGID
jgi:hypothetical protein